MTWVPLFQPFCGTLRGRTSDVEILSHQTFLLEPPKMEVRMGEGSVQAGERENTCVSAGGCGTCCLPPPHLCVRIKPHLGPALKLECGVGKVTPEWSTSPDARGELSNRNNT